ncbi:hypothetical protein [Nocardioides zeae]
MVVAVAERGLVAHEGGHVDARRATGGDGDDEQGGTRRDDDPQLPAPVLEVGVCDLAPGEQVVEEALDRALAVARPLGAGGVPLVERVGQRVHDGHPEPGQCDRVRDRHPVRGRGLDVVDDLGGCEAVGAQDAGQGAPVERAGRADAPEALQIRRREARRALGPQVQHPARAPPRDRVDLGELGGRERGVRRDLGHDLGGDARGDGVEPADHLVPDGGTRGVDGHGGSSSDIKS